MTDLHARDARRYPVSVLCGLLGVSKQAYYKRDENAGLSKAAQEEFALQFIREVRAAVSEAVAFYNNERPHMSIGMMTPVEASNLTGELEKKWRSYRTEAVKKKMQDTDITEKGLPLPLCQRSPSGLRPTVNL